MITPDQSHVFVTDPSPRKAARLMRRGLRNCASGNKSLLLHTCAGNFPSLCKAHVPELEMDVMFICVPTPHDAAKAPDLRYV